MKRNLLFSAVLAMLPMLASAQSSYHEEPNGIVFYCYDFSWYEDIQREAYVVEYLKRNEETGTVVIPETITKDGEVYTVTVIEENAFEDSKFSAIVIPNEVRSIQEEAFSNCKNLATVYIGKKIEHIGEDVFEGCDALRDFTILAGPPPTVSSDAITPELRAQITLHAPIEVLGFYWSDDPFWGVFKAYDDVVNIPTAIENVANSPSIGNRQSFDLLGRQFTQPQKGLNIIREANGNTKKMIIK